MKTIKLSHSILAAWAAGYQEDAVGYYLGKDIPPTPEMELGRLKHDEWEQHIRDTGMIPDELGGGALKAPKVEQKFEKVIPFSEEYQILLRGRLDCLDGDTIYDWKCGKGRPGRYVDSTQMPYYRLLIPEAQLAVYRCFNPYTKDYSSGVRYLSAKDADEALEHIITFGGELITYLEQQDLIIDYVPPEKRPATAGQVRFMKSLGVTIPDGCSVAQASKLIDAAKKRKAAA